MLLAVGLMTATFPAAAQQVRPASKSPPAPVAGDPGWPREFQTDNAWLIIYQTAIAPDTRSAAEWLHRDPTAKDVQPSGFLTECRGLLRPGKQGKEALRVYHNPHTH